ncbi:MAG: hypothetical protein GC138_01225 [Gammaproteobacteria bacterium]|nr:hypothetical protein [Gammaproteobacteria bacterium]
MGASAGFWDRIADRYSKMPAADQAAYRRKLEGTRTNLKPDMAIEHQWQPGKNKAVFIVARKSA